MTPGTATVVIILAAFWVAIAALLLIASVRRITRANAILASARSTAALLRAGPARPLAEAISSAGGVRLEAMDGGLMLAALPGVFCAGEMLDWEAPTGGYLLTACHASGHRAGRAAASWLARRNHPPR